MTLQVADCAIRSLDTSPSGAHVACGGQDGSITLLEMGAGLVDMQPNEKQSVVQVRWRVVVVEGGTFLSTSIQQCSSMLAGLPRVPSYFFFLSCPPSPLSSLLGKDLRARNISGEDLGIAHARAGTQGAGKERAHVQAAGRRRRARSRRRRGETAGRKKGSPCDGDMLWRDRFSAGSHCTQHPSFNQDPIKVAEETFWASIDPENYARRKSEVRLGK